MRILLVQHFLWLSGQIAEWKIDRARIKQVETKLYYFDNHIQEI